MCLPVYFCPLCCSSLPRSCQSSVSGWSRRRRTGRSCRRSCAASGRRGRSWSAQSPSSSSRWPSLARREAAPLPRQPLPPDLPMPTLHLPPPPPPSQRPQRLARSSCCPTRRLSPSSLSSSSHWSPILQTQTDQPNPRRCFLFL